MNIDLGRGLRAGAFAAGFIALLFLLVRSIGWARKHGRGAALFGTALVLLLGPGLAPRPPQQEIEAAREGRKDDESGDPPDPDAINRQDG